VGGRERFRERRREGKLNVEVAVKVYE